MATEKDFKVKNGLQVGNGLVNATTGDVSLRRGMSSTNRIRITSGNIINDTNVIISGNLEVSGNFNITGDINQTSVTTLDVTDKTITVANNAGSAANANNAGLIVDTGGTNPSLLYKSSGDKFSFNKTLEVHSRIETNTLNNIGNTANIIYRSSTNTIVGNNASALVVQDGGNVGIGTTSPSQKLEVHGNIFANVSNGQGLLVTSVSGLVRNNATGIALRTNSTDKLVVTSAGNVGIGTTSPGQPLHVKHSSTHQMRLQGSNSYWNIGTGWSGYYQDYLLFATNTGEKMVLSNAGSVGIGTNDPNTKLHIKQTSSGNFTEALRIENSGGGANEGNYIQWEVANTSGYGPRIGGRREGTGGVGLHFYTGEINAAPTEAMRIDHDGKVGIGTSAPASLLNLSHATAPELRFSRTGTGQQWVQSIDSSGRLLFLEAASTGGTLHTRMVIDDTGEVGIGTGAPAATLEVKASNSSSADWANKGIMSSVQINAANKTFGGLTMVDHGSGSGHAGLGFRYDGTGYKLELGTASSTSSGISTHLTIDRLGAIVTSGHLTVAGDLMAGNVLSTHGHPNADDFIVGNISGTATGLTIVGASGSSGNIHFSDGTSSGNANIQGQLVYSHNDNSMRFYTAVAERMRINSAGNVGIGVTSIPSWANLITNGTVAVGGTLYMKTGNAIQALSAFPGGASDLKMQTGGGKVGIGTTAPMSHLHVNKDTSGHNTDGITLGKVEANGWIDANEEMGRLGWAASYGSSFTPAIGAYISAKADANWNGNEAPTRLGFFTAPENSLTPVERLRIDKDGKVGIRNTNPAATLEVGTLTSGLTGNVIINSEGGNPPALQVKSRTNRARINVQDNDTSGYIIAEGSVLSIGFSDSLTANNLNISNSHNVGIGTTAPVAKLQIEVLGIETNQSSVTSTNQFECEAMSATAFRSARYTVQVTNVTDSTYQITEILLIHDGTTPSITEYGTIFTGSAAEASFDADISSGNVRLLATPASADNMQFKVVRHSILV